MRKLKNMKVIFKFTYSLIILLLSFYVMILDAIIHFQAIKSLNIVP
jgi:hypothetical protein